MITLREFAAGHDTGLIENEPMSRHTTFRIGGPAKYFMTPRSSAALGELAEYCRSAGIRYFIVGNGSNLLVPDTGVDGAVICTGALDDISVSGGEIICGAGANLAKVCLAAYDAGLGGLEFAYGIPGTVGGAVYMNAGAYGGEMKDIVYSARYIDNDEEHEMTGGRLCFGYRRSAFSGTGMIITQASMKLCAADKKIVKSRMDELIKRRKDRQPLDLPSAGSVFKRPEGHFAGALIESCGLKGASCGGAMVSRKHAGFIVNAGGATCADVLGLIDRIKSEVLRQTGVELECEIKTLA